jgi:hypothetical protein
MPVTLHHQPSNQAGSRPVIAFLHGQGEIGGDPPDRVRVHGPWAHLMLNQRALPEIGRFHVVGLHLPDGQYWDPPDLAEANDLLNEFVGDPANRADPDRIFLTGVSIGGAGACMLADMRLRKRWRNPKWEPVAAVAAFCPTGWAQEPGTFRYEAMDETLGAIPSYLFCHPCDAGRWAGTERLRALLGGNCRLREIHNNELGVAQRWHLCWHRVFGCPAFYQALDPTPDAWVL